MCCRLGQHTLNPTTTTLTYGPRFNYELFNCNNFCIRYWSWNYRGCWHQTCPPIDPRVRGLACSHSNCEAS